MARTGEEAQTLPDWDLIEAKFWTSTRVKREDLDAEHAALFAEKIQEPARAQKQLNRELEAILDEEQELKGRLAQLQELAEQKQRGIEELDKQQAVLKRRHEQECALVVEQRALEDKGRREMFVMYRANDVQAVRPAEPERALEEEPWATPSPPPSPPPVRPEVMPAAGQDAQQDGQHKVMVPSPNQAEVPPDVDRDIQGQAPSQTEAEPPQAQPNDQPALQPNGHHQPTQDSANEPVEPLSLEQPKLNAPPNLGLEIDLPSAPIDDESILPGEGIGETGDALVTPLSRHPSSEATSRLSTPPSEPQMDIDLVSLSQGLPPIGQLDAGEKPASVAPERSPRASGGFTAVNAGSARPSPSVANHGGEDGDVSGTATNNELPPKRKTRATRKAQANKRMSEVQAKDGSTPSDDEEQPPLKEITKEVLMLRDDGVVFTDPPAMRGVPLAKITKGDAYWDDEWPDLEERVASSLEQWKAKHVEDLAGNASRAVTSLNNRQVNRGNDILNFLREGELHPFQIMGKDHIKKGLAHYDKVFRMVKTLEELNAFAIDVTPSQWLRHRLCEVLEEQGDKFDLAHTVSGLYHDPKVVAIRYKSGFRNIGRPPGYEPPEKPVADGKDSEASSAKKTARKRKTPHATPKTSPKKAGTRGAAPGPEVETPAAASPSGRQSPEPFGGADQQHKPEPLDSTKTAKAPATSPSPTRGAKKACLGGEVAAEDLDCDGYTTTDTISRLRLYREDWRLNHIKHVQQEAVPEVTQYWHWVEEAQLFEHQVLTTGLDWGIYAMPFDFHLRLGELCEVTMAVGSRKIVVGTRPYEDYKPRGDILVDFKRDRTKRRFLRFLKMKGIRVVKTTEAFVEDRWNSMKSLSSPGSF